MAETLEGHPADANATHYRIAQRAFEIFQARGGTHGQDFDDWLRAEQELGASQSETVE